MIEPGPIRCYAIAALVLLCAACHEPKQTPPEPVVRSDLAAEWRSETIELPSQFAPGLPKGVEELRFAPGMYDKDAADYWSYVFVLRLEEKVDGATGLRKILDQYYTGLITAVAAGRNVTLDRPAARIELEAEGDRRYRARIDLVDAFVTGKPLTVNVDVRLEPTGAGTHVLAAASPQPRAHAIWRNLHGVLAAIE